MSRDITTKKNQDGTTTVWDSNGYAGKLPSDKDTRAPGARADEIRELLRNAKGLEGVAPQETIDEIYEKANALLREAEEEGEEVTGLGDPGQRPATVKIGAFADEDPDEIRPFEHWEQQIQASRPPLREFELSEAANYTQSRLAALSVAIDSGQPVFLWAEPGTGKTQTILGLAKTKGFEVLDINAAQTPGNELLGQDMIYIPEGGTHHDASAPKIPPAWMRKIQNNPHKRFIVFLDEFSNATPNSRAALLTVILDRKAGDTQLGANVTFVAAGNPVDHATNGFELDQATSNRFMHLDYDIPQDEGVDQVKNGFWKAPNVVCTRADYESQHAAVRSLMVSYWESGGSRQNMPREGDPDYGRGWPSGRSWEKACDMLARARAAGAHPEVIENITRGMLGNADGIEFLTYMEKNDLPPLKEVLSNPDKWKPADTDRAFSTISAIITDCRKKTDENGKMTDAEQWQQTGYALKRLADLGMSDIAAKQAREWLDMIPPGMMPPRELLTVLGDTVRKRK